MVVIWEIIMQAAITAIGTATPLYRCSQQKIAEIIAARLNLNAKEKRLLKLIYKATGIEYRYSVLSDANETLSENFFPSSANASFPTTAIRMQVYKEHAFRLAAASIENCLTMLESFNKATITHLITVSCTGMYAPGLDVEIVQKLQLKSTVQRTAINFMGCYAAFTAIKLAYAICNKETNAKVLIVCIELCSIHLQRSMSSDHAMANALFADGAATILIETSPRQNKYFSLQNFHCELLPQTTQEMAWFITDYGFDMVLSSYVPAAIKVGIIEIMKKFSAANHPFFSNNSFYAIHPGGIKILQACEDSLGIDKESNKYAYQVLCDYGNMSSATILFVLKNIWHDITELDNQKNIFSCAFGPGLTFEAMQLRVNFN